MIKKIIKINKTIKRMTTYTIQNDLYIYRKLRQGKVRGRSEIVNKCIDYCRRNNVNLAEI